MSKTVTFEDIVNKKEGFLRGPFGGDLKKEIFVPKAENTYKVYEQGVVLQKNPNIGDYYITKEYFDKKMYRFEVRPKDFLVSCSGVNYGAIYQLEDTITKGVINQALLRIRLNKDIIDDDYFYYLFQSYVVRMIVGKKGDSTIPNFPAVSILKKLKFQILDLEIQKKVGGLLKIIDSKIELNNKINAELETMAKTLYDYWFVQFDFPDENGKPYKSSGGEMVYDEKLKREIPKGWEVKKLKDILKKNNKKFNLNDKKHNIDTIDLSVMPSSTMCLNEKNTSDEFGTNLFEMNKFDILFGGIRPYLLKAGFAPFSGLVTGTVHSFDVIYEYDYNFALLTMIHESMFQFAISNSKGTKMPVVGADDLLEYKLAYNENIVKKFNEIVFFKEIISKNILENQKLAELRDFLLPMLMNGQVVVK